VISVIVLSWQDAEYAARCIESVKQYTEAEHVVTLIDNGSDARNRDILRGIANVDFYHREPVNTGLPKGYNIGIEQAMTSKDVTAVCLLNADTEIRTQGWLGNMLAVFNHKPDAGMVAATTNKIANRVQNWKRYGNKLPLEIMQAPWVGLGMTMIPVEVIRKVGMLDENMTPGAGVDCEYSLRLFVNGYKCYVDGHTFVWHKGKVAFDQMAVPYKTYQKAHIAYIKKKYPASWRMALK